MHHVHQSGVPIRRRSRWQIRPEAYMKTVNWGNLSKYAGQKLSSHLKRLYKVSFEAALYRFHQRILNIYTTRSRATQSRERRDSPGFPGPARGNVPSRVRQTPSPGVAALLTVRSRHGPGRTAGGKLWFVTITA